ncbi:MAG: serine--tRNA ligase [Deltaproteobacteria bacterium]|nr:serine--tRNA ligase [Deltaproteobacteria bacterium]
MLDRKFVRDNLELVEKMLAARRSSADLAAFAELESERRKTQSEYDGLRNRQKSASEEIARTKREKGDASAILAEMSEISARVKEMEPRLREIDEKTDEILLTIPNIPDERTPIGAGEQDNPVVRTWGAPREFEFEPKDHVDIGAALGILDMERAAKLSGARFSMQIGAGARLERALINFMLDLHTAEHGYTEVWTPSMVNSATMTGTGQLPKFASDLFHIEGRDLWLIPTAEVPVTNIYRDETLDESMLPMKFCAYTPCFRSEAGAYGKDTRGMIRVHQFDKVELVKLTHPDASGAEHEALTNNAERVLQLLGLPYRVVELCTADLGFSAKRCFDIEVWLPGQSAYREISSCSNFGDFQARRAGLRFRSKGEKGSRFVHTINGSGLAVGRTFVAVLENYQNTDGSVTVPEALRPYMGGITQISPR